MRNRKLLLSEKYLPLLPDKKTIASNDTTTEPCIYLSQSYHSFQSFQSSFFFCSPSSAVLHTLLEKTRFVFFF